MRYVEIWSVSILIPFIKFVYDETFCGQFRRSSSSEESFLSVQKTKHMPGHVRSGWKRYGVIRAGQKKSSTSVKFGSVWPRTYVGCSGRRASSSRTAPLWTKKNEVLNSPRSGGAKKWYLQLLFWAGVCLVECNMLSGNDHVVGTTRDSYQIRWVWFRVRVNDRSVIVNPALCDLEIYNNPALICCLVHGSVILLDGWVAQW